MPHAPSSHRRGVVAVVVRDGELLVIQRSETVRAPLAYCFPGGGIEPDESEPDALIREFQEELGAPLRPLRPLWRSTTPWGVELAWWQGELASAAPLVANPAEVAQILWLPPDQMRHLPNLLESNHHFLDALAAGTIDLEI